MEELGPFLPLCRHLGRLGTQLALCGSIESIEVECLGRIAERDTRPLVTAVLLGVLQGNTEEPANEVNAHALADERGIRVSETSSTTAHDFTDLVRVKVNCGSGPRRSPARRSATATARTCCRPGGSASTSSSSRS